MKSGRCEFLANEVYRKGHGSDYIWLKEHLENGLPSLPEILNLIKNYQTYFVTIPNGYLPRWFEMISIFLLTEGKSEFQPMMAMLNELYNQDFYRYDNRNPAYRQIIIIPKEDRIIDFSDLTAKIAETAEINNRTQFLKSFIEKIKQSYRIKEKQDKAIVAKDAQLQELVIYTRSLEQSLTLKDEYLREITTYSKKMDSQVTLLTQRINEECKLNEDLNAQVTSLAQQINEECKLNEDLNAQVTSLAQQINEECKLNKDLNAQVTSLAQQIITTKSHILTLENDIHAMKQSILWQFCMKFDNKIVQKIFPDGSKRKEKYNLMLKGGRIAINEGLGELFSSIKVYRHEQKSNAKLKENNKIYNVYQKNDKLIPDTDPEKNLIIKLDLFLSEKRQLKFPKYEKPVVSIIILTFNKAAYTYQCLESLINYTDIPYEVILVDNGSTDNTQALLGQTENIGLILNEKNLGFIRGCNQGAIPARGKYLLFLNNDTVVTKNWLSDLVSTAESDQSCGAVGCKLVWPYGQLQEAGSIVWRDGSVTGYGRGDDPLKPEYSYLKEIDFCSGACLLVRRDLFKILKGFDERYIPAYYEDADLCLGIQSLGYKIIYQPKVTVYHHEFTSSSKDHAINFMMSNQLKFVKKWENYLKIKESCSPGGILNSRDLRKGKRILVIDDRIPASNQGSGYPRANTLLRYLGELGYKVTFFPLANTTPWQPFTSQLQDLGIEVFYGDFLNFEKFSQTRSNFFDVVIISRPHNFERSFQTIKSHFPDAYLVYDAEALFSTREILKAAVEGLTLDDYQISNLREKEFKLMRNADLIITVSENEREIIQKNGGFDNCVVFGYPVQIQDTIPEFKARQDILFVGSFLSPNGPNDDAVLYFIREIWPKVQKRLSCKLYVVGINPPGQIQKLASSSVIVTGFVQDLERCYNNCRIFIVPHRYAAGIPLKLIEAMSLWNSCSGIRVDSISIKFAGREGST